jgi:hypothetical protein
MAAATAIRAAASALSRPCAKASLSQSLTTPSKVAHCLDWKKASGSILSLRVNNETDTLDLAVASHPFFDEAAQPLQSIPLDRSVDTQLNRKVVSDSVAAALQQVVSNYNVCGMVVSWPVQPEGWCGASCGRVLNTLDQICLTVNRPVCLYDAKHASPPEDEWGRAELYSAVPAPDKHVHVASQEQYPDCSGNVAAAQVWNDFMHEHWPEFQDNNEYTTSDYKNDYYPQEASKKNLLFDPSWLSQDKIYQDAF